MVPLNIDWQQILLHLMNFVILAGGLYLLLYKPVKKFMDARQDHYHEMAQNAQEKLEEAAGLKNQYEQQLKDSEVELGKLKAQAMTEADAAAKQRLAQAEEQRRQVLEQAKKEAQAEKERILQQAGGEIEGIISQAIDNLLASKTGDPIDDFLDQVEGQQP
ncbi:MAG: hypothetical protein LUF86_04435 [Clostridiales bacterium]|nr:hypothetical protein [Clostridiales bacterium]